MDKTKCISVYNGYRVEEKAETLDLNKAVGILSTKKQRKYSYAVRNDNSATATLYSHKVVCPGCGKETPAYARYINKAIKKHSPLPPGVPKNIVRSWGNMQLSLFAQESEKLFLYNVVIDNEDYTCPHCGEKSSKGSFFADVIIDTDEECVKVSTVADSRSTIELIKKSDNLKAGNLPLTESISFDFAEGVVWLSVEDSRGNVLEMQGLSATVEEGFGKNLCRFINGNKAVKRVLKKAFVQKHGRDCPFLNKELSVEKFVVMTWFVGYNRYFYDSLPYGLDSNDIASDFRGIAKELHTKESARRFFESSLLPNIKSVRKCMFENPALLFYVHELEDLWKLYEDANLFCRLLEIPTIYDLLYEMHLRPCLVNCFSDYVKAKYKRRLITGLKDSFAEVIHYFVNYSTLGEAAKQKERNTWKHHEPFRRSERINGGFSKPMHKPEKGITDCLIDGFSFFWLRNGRDYAYAGKQLGNCLGEWHSGDNPVVCVTRDDIYVAAIEIHGREIRQARGSLNSDIDEEFGFSEAYRKWCKRYALKKRKSMLDFLDYDNDV